MDLNADEIRALLEQAGYPRHITDLMVAELDHTSVPKDKVLVVLDTVLWGGDMQLGRVATSMTTATAWHLRDQLTVLLDRLETK